MISTTPLFDMTVQLEPAVAALTPSGLRTTHIVTGGSFDGARLTGRVLPGGGDWLLTDPTGVGHVDVRVQLETDDSTIIHVHYTGRLRLHGDALDRLLAGKSLTQDDAYLRVAPLFDTPPGPHDWLNGIQAIGTGRLRPDGVDYSFSAVD